MKKHYPYAFVTFIIKDDNYLPGALLLGYSLRKQEIIADLICIVSEDISDEAISTLENIYDYVLRLPSIYIRTINDQKRQYLPFVFTRIHALRLGDDGDLGFKYKKVIILDSDILPIRGYQQLFLLESPAGILNEKKEYTCGNENTFNLHNGIWNWHSQYQDIPHGCKIPKYITDRVIFDYSNYGINTALLVLEPSMDMYDELFNDIHDQKIVNFISNNFKWPDMQFLTLKWSGLWHNIDISYASFHGYPNINIINGNHYVGPKPWQLNNKSVKNVYSKYEDYKYWYNEFLTMVENYSKVMQNKYIRKLRNNILNLTNGITHNKKMQ